MSTDRRVLPLPVNVQEQIDRDILRAAIYVAVSKLPSQNQEWFFLWYEGGQPVRGSAIADAYSKKSNTVSQTLRRTCIRIAITLLETGWPKPNLRDLLPSPPALYADNRIQWSGPTK